MVGDTHIFKVFSEDRVQQVLSRLLIFPVEVCIAQDRVHLHHLHLQLVFMVLQMSLARFFFQKKYEVRRESESEGARQWQLMDSGGL